MKKRFNNLDIVELYDIKSSDDLPQVYIEGLRQCIESAFGGGITNEDALNHMQGDQLLLGVESSGSSNVVGFSATNIETSTSRGLEHPSILYPCAYFAASAVAKDYQGMGFYGELNDRRLDFAETNGLRQIYTRTQNPHVEREITQALERMVSRRKIGSFIVDRCAVVGAYDGMLTATKPVSSTISYDELNYERGDANIITWRLLD